MRYSDELEIGSVIALHPANTDLARLPHRIETDPGGWNCHYAVAAKRMVLTSGWLDRSGASQCRRHWQTKPNRKEPKLRRVANS
jgi:hypothetical protein